MILPLPRPAVVFLVSVLGATTALGAPQGAPPEPLPPREGRVLWLRADRGAAVELGGTVATWTGVDGQGVALAQADGSRRPVAHAHGVGGRAGLSFDGNDSLTSDGGMPTGDYTKVAVVVLEDYGSANGVLCGAGEHALSYEGSDRAQMAHAGTFVTSSVPTPLGVPTVLVASFDADAGEGRLWQDGTLVGSGYAAPHADPGIEVGSFAGGGHLHGSVAEVLVYGHVLADDERRWVERLLLARYRARGAPVVDFGRAPRHGQVLQRDAAGRARASFAGAVATAGYDGIELRVRRDGAPWSRTTRPLTYLGGTAAFEIEAQVMAGLHDYDLEVALLGPDGRRPVRRVDAVACGDTFLINGQSNAVAEDYWDEGLANQAQSHWVRSFGSSLNGTHTRYDLNWGLADGERGHAHCAVGAWGLRLAALLSQQHQVPVAVVNGAVSGTAIQQHLRYDPDPTLLASIYGRLLYRARLAGIADGARALLWHQGESDQENVIPYAADFATLHAAWREDYPALEKIYTFQIRKGCLVTKAGVREFQRRAPDVYPDLEVMSTTAAPEHDGCHFRYAGYRELGDRITRLVERDLYGSTDTHEIDAPNIAWAERTGAAGDEILLTFRDPDDALVFEAGAEADFSLNDQVDVVSGTASGNTILLKLSGPTTASRISYVGHSGDGPWVRNARGVGALTFFKVPIAP